MQWIMISREPEQPWMHNFQNFQVSTAKCVHCKRTVSYGNDISPLEIHTLFHHSPMKQNTLVWLYFDKICEKRTKCKDCGRCFLRSDKPEDMGNLKLHLAVDHNINNQDVSWIHQCYKMKLESTKLECFLCNALCAEDTIRDHLKTHNREIPPKIQENEEELRNWELEHLVTNQCYTAHCIICRENSHGTWSDMKEHYNKCRSIQMKTYILVKRGLRRLSVSSEVDMEPEDIRSRLHKLSIMRARRSEDSYEESEINATDEC